MLGGPMDGTRWPLRKGQTVVRATDGELGYEYTLEEDGRLHFASWHVSAEFDHERFERCFRAYAEARGSAPASAPTEGSIR